MGPIDREPPRSCARFVVAAMLAAGIAGTAAPAWARSEKTLAYPRDQVWPTAVRFLVVDEHVKVTEKDADAGYVMFELREEGKVFRGSLEVVTVNHDGRTAVRFVLQLADRPSWLEIAMLRRLESKLQAELGSPSPAPSEPPHKAEPGKDAGKAEPGKDAGKAEPGKDAGKAEPGKDSGKDSVHDGGPPISATP